MMFGKSKACTKQLSPTSKTLEVDDKPAIEAQNVMVFESPTEIVARSTPEKKNSTPPAKKMEEEEECKEIEDFPVIVELVISDMEDTNGGNPSSTGHDQAEGCNRVDSANFQLS